MNRLKESASSSVRLELFVVLDAEGERYYLMKVIRCGFDVYWSAPGSSYHGSLHESGEAHFRRDKVNSSASHPEVIAQMGEMGENTERGIQAVSIKDLQGAVGICSEYFSVDSPDTDYREFRREASQQFVVDAKRFPPGTRFVEIGVWAVPHHNTVAFDPDDLEFPISQIHKVAGMEPQIWMYARACP